MFYEKLEVPQPYQSEVGNNSQEVLNIFENLLLSEINQRIRVTVAEFLARIFPKKSRKPLKWAIQHKTSVQVLNELRNLVNRIDNKRKLHKTLLKAFIKRISLIYGVIAEEAQFPNLLNISQN